ncbi:hypothetical protein FOVG_14050 [Fusarium oxysporum f. sp. pisi HDV247]|uniref:Uncharacterized protein n=1 Tax=Fusarium oxysporum f. sp. pisi HDV247 TaxID=1080344 RepID=W9P3R2_FUSOX|nr:hypothetical protein FOVG_14048 [Fusarium oxysporum f. sp. pisi HDV247]EXA34627.1 hypothetical protein FOVG_14050 [Fusarium oxysporum f. sp. pisi HDV247]
MAPRSDNADCASVWGDFVGWDDEGNVEDASEPTERYDEGLYYPICIGEILVDRYRIEHNLSEQLEELPSGLIKCMAFGSVGCHRACSKEREEPKEMVLTAHLICGQRRLYFNRKTKAGIRVV